MAKILIVEDDPLLSRMYQKKFSEDGFDVEVARDGEEGMAKARVYNPTAILLDIMMPKVNGLEVLRKLKESSETASVPVVLLTNVARGEEDIEKGLELGAVAYLVKSENTPIQVVAKVKEILAASTKLEVPEVPQA